MASPSSSSQLATSTIRKPAYASASQATAFTQQLVFTLRSDLTMREIRIDAKAALVFIINYRVLTLSLTLSPFFCGENNESTINTTAPSVIKLSAALKAGQ